MSKDDLVGMMNTYTEVKSKIDKMVGKEFLNDQINKRKGKISKDFISPGTYVNGFADPTRDRATELGVCCSLIDGWSLSKPVYSISPDLIYALVNTEGTLDVPVDILYQLRHWTVYIPLEGVLGEAPYGVWVGMRRIQGEAYMCLAWDTVAMGVRQAAVELVRCVPTGDRGMCHLVPYLREIPDRLKSQAVQFLSMIVNVILYVCTQVPYSCSNGTAPNIKKPAGKSKAWKCVPVSEPVIVSITDTRVPPIRDHTSATPGYGEVHRRAHIRKAHWHGYWTGPRDAEQTFILKWIPPTVVSASLPATTSEQL